MRAVSAAPVRNFSIGFHEPAIDEAGFAREVARHLGTDHRELYVSPRDALDTVHELPAVYDEPLGDSSAVPTVILSRLARGHVTVALSGDGGDELFLGYPSYFNALERWRAGRGLPAPVRELGRPLGGGAGRLPRGPSGPAAAGGGRGPARLARGGAQARAAGRPLGRGAAGGDDRRGHGALPRGRGPRARRRPGAARRPGPPGPSRGAAARDGVPDLRRLPDGRRAGEARPGLDGGGPGG